MPRRARPGRRRGRATRVQRSPGCGLPGRAAEREERHAGGRGGGCGHWRRCARRRGAWRRSGCRRAWWRGCARGPRRRRSRRSGVGAACGAGSRVRPASDRVTARPGRAASRAARSRASPVPPRIRMLRGPMQTFRGETRPVADAKVAGGGRHRRGRRRRARRGGAAAYRRGGGGVRRAAASGAGGAADPRRGAGLAEPVRPGDGGGGGAARPGGLRARLG